jgi:signal transduction histidine kinase
LSAVEEPEGVEQHAAIGGARRAMACISHELSGPLMALQTHLKLARRRHEDASLDTALRCVERIGEITKTLQQASRLDRAGEAETMFVDLATAARGCSVGGRAIVVDVAAAAPARVAAGTAVFILQAAVTAVARTLPDGVDVRVTVDANRCTLGDAGAPDWRAVSPLASARHGLELWLAALAALDAGGTVHVCDADGLLAVQVTLAEAP